MYLYPLNTQVLNVVGLQDITTGLFLNAATVVATLFDEHGNADPIINNLAMGYIPASNGQYQGTVPDTFNAKLGGGYNMVITALQAGIQAQFTIPAQVRLRTQ
jgi:hypothetical protein